MPSSSSKSSRAEKSSKRNESDRPSARGKRAESAAIDAVSVLKADHQQVAEWFKQFQDETSEETKQQLAQQICAALTVHATIEEEIFYPAFLDATGRTELHHEAEIEHEGAKALIAEIEELGPGDEYFDARVKVLAEMIKHHVNEEEQPDGMFDKAEQSDMDLESLGEQLQSRKEEITDDQSPKRRAG
jgi:hemerythrin superfamily protein